MEDKKKNSKFVTTILIGGALGSFAALLFRGKRCAGDCSPTGSSPKKSFFQRLFGKKGS